MSLLLSSALVSLVLGQAAAASPAPTPVPTPAVPAFTTPTDAFGPDLKAWLDASKLKDQDSANKALLSIQRRRAERNLAILDDVAGVVSGRSEVQASEGATADAVLGLSNALGFEPDSATAMVRKARAEGKTGDAWRALDLVSANPLESGRIRSFMLLTLLVIGGLFAAGFSLGQLLRYAAVFSHDVTEGLPAPLKPLSLAMAVIFLSLPLAALMGWGYLPFWWIALLFIFGTRAERTVSTAVLVGLVLCSATLPLVLNQREVDAAIPARSLYLAANGGVSAEAEALVKERLAEDPTNAEWSLLSASLARRSGRFDDAATALLPRAAAEPRFAHNAAALEFNKGNFEGALPGFTMASEASSLSSSERATALYNLSLVQTNKLSFDAGKESRTKADGLDAALMARYDRVFSFDRDGSTLQAPPDIVPPASAFLGSAVPQAALTANNAVSRLTFVGIGLLLFIPAVMKFRGAQSFSKQCPKCGTTFCWLCQTRSTSQDVCSQCHHLFVVKRGIPPAARAAKSQEISRYVTLRGLVYRLSSVVAPGAGHLSVGHASFGLPFLLVWAMSLGAVLGIHFLAPLVLTSGPLGSLLKNLFAVLAVLTYVAAQMVKPVAPAVAVAPRRVREGAQA
jgi:tetratricopeptide (TPR) repeat protein